MSWKSILFKISSRKREGLLRRIASLALKTVDIAVTSPCTIVDYRIIWPVDQALKSLDSSDYEKLEKLTEDLDRLVPSDDVESLLEYLDGRRRRANAERRRIDRRRRQVRERLEHRNELDQEPVHHEEMPQVKGSSAASGEPVTPDDARGRDRQVDGV